MSETGRLVALKVLPTSGDVRSARFARERAIAATLDHPHIVPVYDAGVDAAGRAYIAMRFVRGSDLSGALADGPLATERALAILEQVAQALDAAHDRGLVHRDVKPGNILMERRDGLDAVFLSDFGLVKELVVDDALSTTGAMLGTPDYVPPEIVLSGSADARGDVYALGCVLFEMLTGAPPFRRESDVATLWAHVNDDPPSLLDAAPELPAALDGVIACALAKEPDDRFGSAGDLAAAACAAARGKALERAPPSRAETARCPYKGLAVFDQHDADIFFGREGLVARLAARLQESPFLAVVGASGSGKSSLVRAGLLPALAEPAGLMTPGARPLEALASASPATVLVVDQFEELFTLCHDDMERHAFVARLLADARPVVIVLRADFYARCTEIPQLASLLERNQAVVGPMTEAQLRDAIEKPAQRVGLHLERRLLETAIRDVSGQPGALPLLSHALLETWNRRVGRTLTLAGYLEAGGVEGALARTAQATYDGLDAADRELARGTFLRLTALGEGTEDTRRRVAISELARRPDEEAAVAQLLDRLAAARLVSVDLDTAEIAHEALIRHWPTFQAWLNEDRDGRRLHRRITESAQEWAALDRDAGALLRGGRLVPAAEWAGAHDHELNERERDFIAASSAAEEQELAAVRRRNRRLRTLVVALAVLLVVAAVAAVVAVRQTGAAQTQQAAALDQSRIALSRGLAGQSLLLLGRRLDQALLVAVEAVRAAPTDEALDALRAAVQRTSGIDAILSGDVPAASAVALSDGGRMAVVGDADGRIESWDVALGRRIGEPYELSTGEGGDALSAIAISPDGSKFAALTDDGAVWIASIREPHDARRLSPETFDISYGAYLWSAVAFSGDGLRVVAASGRSAGASPRRVTVRAWWVTPGGERIPDVGTTTTGGRALVLSRDASTVAIAVEQRVVVADAGTGMVLARLDTGSTNGGQPAPLALSSDGHAVATTDGTGAVTVWDVETAVRRFTLPSHGSVVGQLAFAADDRDLVIANDRGDVEVVDAAGGRVTRPPRRTHASDIVGVATARHGSRVVSIGVDGLLVEQSLDDRHGLQRVTTDASGATAVAVSPDGRRVAMARNARPVSIVDATTGRSLGDVDDSIGAVAVAFSPDGRLLAVVGLDHRLRLHELDTGRLADRSVRLDEYDGAPVEFSPDGTYVAGAGRPSTGDVNVWRRGAATATILRASLPRRVHGLAFAQDGSRIALAWSDGVAEVRETADMAGTSVTVKGHRGPVEGVAFSPDGRLLASVGADGTLRLWRARDLGAVGEPLRAGAGALTAVEFAAGGQILETLGTGGLRFWDVARRVPIGEGLALAAEPGLQALVVPRTGEAAVVIAGGRVLRVDDLLWSDDVAALTARVCSVVGRSMTRVEFAQFLPDTPYREECQEDRTAPGSTP